MAKTKTVTHRKAAPKATFDGVYLLKMLLYLLAGSLWVKISSGEGFSLWLPVGFVIGLLFTRHERFQIDRKMEYVALLAGLLIGFFASFGLYIDF